MKIARGLPELQTAEDLMEKVRHDASRLDQAPTDAYAAFDFFVTANCLSDWLINDGRRAVIPPADPTEAAAIVVCRQIANGLKHFVKKTAGTSAHSGVFSSAFDPGAFNTDNVFVFLNPVEAATFGRDRISVIDLERRLLAYWERVFRPAGVTPGS